MLPLILGASRTAIIDWLETGDVAICYQVGRDLRSDTDPALQDEISKEGWGAALLARRNADGSRELGFYQPKWTSSHYALLHLKSPAISPANPLSRWNTLLAPRA